MGVQIHETPHKDSQVAYKQEIVPIRCSDVFLRIANGGVSLALAPRSYTSAFAAASSAWGESTFHGERARRDMVGSSGSSDRWAEQISVKFSMPEQGCVSASVSFVSKKL